MGIEYRSGKYDELFERVAEVLNVDGWISSEEFAKMADMSKQKAYSILRNWTYSGRLQRKPNETSIFVAGHGINKRYATKETQ